MMLYIFFRKAIGNINSRLTDGNVDRTWKKRESINFVYRNTGITNAKAAYLCLLPHVFHKHNQ